MTHNAYQFILEGKIYKKLKDSFIQNFHSLTKNIYQLIITTVVLTTTITAHATIIDIYPDKKYLFYEHAEILYSESSVKDALSIIDQFTSKQKSNTMAKNKKIVANKPANIWFKIDIHNPINKKIDLFFVGSDTTMPWQQLTVVKNENIVLQKTQGNDLASANNLINYRLFLVPLSLHPGEIITLIVGMENHNTEKSIWLESQAEFWSTENLITLTDGIYLGTILLIGIMSALLYITDRDPLYLYIYVIIIGNTAYHFSRSGYLHHYLWLKIPGSNPDWALTMLCLSIIGGILFTMHFLSLKTQKQRWPYVVSIAYLVFNLGTVAVNYIANQNIALILTTMSKNIASLYFLLLWFHSARRSLASDLRARVYTIVWLFYLVLYLSSVFSIYYSIENEWSKLLFLRNGDVFLVLALWTALILDVRNTHMEKNAAIVESKAKSTFMATMSHELRTPLNGVIGMGELLHQTKQTPIQRQYSDVIVSSGNVLLTLINDILDLTKINDGKLEFEKKPFRLDKMLPECTSSFIPEMVKQNTPLHTSMDTKTPYNLIGDEYRLRQILFNLLSNAMKFTENGSVNIIASGNVTNNPSIFNLKLEVIDTGIGIEKNALEHIFHQFSQADASTTRRFGGTGLGLAITKAIVEQMNGFITVRSIFGQGSTFTVSIPMEVDCDAEERRLASLSILAGKRILAIRDTPYLYNNTHHHINSWGIHMDIVIGIDMAKKKLLECDKQPGQHYDLVTADFVNNPQKKLHTLRDLKKKLIIFHHSQLDAECISWVEKTWMLPTPVPLGKLSDTFREAFTHDYHNCISGMLPTLENIKVSTTTVLVVEDNLTNQLVIKGMLKYLGMAPDIANNGQEAVDMAAKHDYDIILMDCEMPIMDGFKASRIIMENNRSPKPFITALTAHAHKDTLIQCKKVGIQHVLHKPITIENLKKFFDTIS